MDGDWLKTQFVIYPDKNQVSLAKALSLEPPAISKILSGKRQIKAREYAEMRRFFGLPVDGEKAARGISSRSYTLEPLSPALQEEGTKTDDAAWIMPASLFESRTKALPDQIRIFDVQENAMNPDFVRGEQVLVDLSDTKPSPPGVFVVSDGMSYIIRQCEHVPHSEPPEIKLSASNESYKPYTLKLEQAEIIGRIIAKLQWL